MDKEFIITEDGSHTIYLPEIDEHYHSIHGAIQESLHIYIGEGLFQTNKKELCILEIGFGTGLNAYLTYCYAREKNLSVNYFSIEKYPLTEAEYLKLNYPVNTFPEYSSVFEKMHRSEWNTAVKISPEFTLQKVHADLLSFQFNSIPEFDLVYYDAFAPGKQPEMWTNEILHRVAGTVKKDGILVTYCAKGVVRRSLAAAGFQMERIPGPIGKKEILRGKKTF
ncbi:MAG TPA: tRNA (5-methylaminomethyl-2-thiouridine)(34)-methyltransferase MnmD [Prolixibacteraceae bacterium]|nr:tRNA (5-methylaminomethyl-2-thiouridine)(34)-methyltransferase MnmD [Prolixibacteraceae bacterium]